jgi:hypothetical protein
MVRLYRPRLATRRKVTARPSDVAAENTITAAASWAW